MTQTCNETKIGENYSTAHLGPFEKLTQYKFSHEGLPMDIEGKIFLNTLLKLSSAEVSLNCFPPNTSMPFHHHHQANEEIYVFVRGRGEFQVDGETFSVTEGSVVAVAPNGSRCWRSLPGEPLYFIVIQAPAGQYKSGVSINDGVGDSQPVVWPATLKP